MFLKFKRGMPAVSSMTTPLRVYMLRICSVVILVLTINSLKMKQMVDFFCFAVVEQLRAEFISKCNFGREEVFNIQMVATANNRRAFNIIYLHYLQNNIQKIE